MRRGERRGSESLRDEDEASSPGRRHRTHHSMLTVRILVVVVVCLFAMLVVMGQMLLRDPPPASTAPLNSISERRNLAKGAIGALALRSGKQRPPIGEPVNANMTLAELRSLKEEERLSWLHQIREGRVVLESAPDRMHGIVGLDDNAETYYRLKEKPPADMNMVEELRRGGGFNLRLSDAEPLDRSIPDGRHRACKRITYQIDRLPEASVVIVFYNEPFSTLMRSVHSVLNLTPPSLLREIILVDDGSDLEWIKLSGSGELDLYVTLLPKVRLIRLPKRKGIVGARLAGIRAAEAPVFAILDSHIEVQPGWLEPLVQRIGEDRTRVLMPQVDGIIPETLVPTVGGIGCTLGFLWKLIEHTFTPGEDSTPERRNAGPTDFVPSPTMAGGLFAADVDFFLNDMGGYDEAFEFWGTENLELSFRLWTCGGRLECAPCSRVYHIFRKGGMGYSSPAHSTTRNKLRTLAIWMDEYADLAWRVIGQPHVDFGPIDEVQNFRREKECKSFQWFLDNVNPESFVKAMPGDVPYLGPLKNANTAKCIDLANDYPGGARARPYTCHGGQNQDFMYFRRVEQVMPVRNDETCFVVNGDAGSTDWCHKGQDRWSIVPVGENIQLKSEKNKCLAEIDSALAFVRCDEGDLNQLWVWTPYTPPKVWTPPPN